MIRIENLGHTYKGDTSFDFPDFQCDSAETLLVLGDSGVGKTTLLHILAGILKPKRGTVQVHNQDLYSLSSNHLDKFRGEHIGLVFQKPHFVQSISAIENLILAQKLAGTKVDNGRIKKLLDQLNIHHRAASLTKQMSQGEQQRLSIARALINNPKVILADEPTSALDDNNCKEVTNLLSQQAQLAGAALVIVTHDNRLKEIFPNKVELH